MKRNTVLACILVLLFCLTACGNPGRTSSASESDAPSKSIAVFDLENGTVLLNSGYTMPILGIGCFTLTDEEAENSVYWALRDGYRLIDTARIYGNEEGVGRGIQRAIDEEICKREDIFVTTRYGCFHGAGRRRNQTGVSFCTPHGLPPR